MAGMFSFFIRVHSLPVRHSFVDHGSVRCGAAKADLFVVNFVNSWLCTNRFDDWGSSGLNRGSESSQQRDR